MSIDTLKKRADIPEQEKWKIEDLFSDETEWEKAYEALQNEIPDVRVYKGRLQESADVLLACLQTHERLQEKLIPIMTYARLQMATDGTDPNNQYRQGKASALYSEYQQAVSFITSEIIALSEETISAYFRESPELHNYDTPIQAILREKPYAFSQESEEILAALGEVHDAPFKIYQQSKSSDLSFPPFKDDLDVEYPLSFALYEDKYEFSAKTSVRRNAYEKFIEGLSRYQDTYASTYATEVRKQVLTSRLRGYDSVTDMLLHNQRVSRDTYERQIDTIYEQLAPHMQRYAKLKQRILGLNEMTFADLKAPMDPDYEPEISYGEGAETILNALEIMGSEYVSIMEKGLYEGWVDRANNIGKQTGAFCSSPYGAHPYILITWTNMMRGTFVLAHELGHAGHFYLANQHQRAGSVRPSTYMIEAPSTMNEMLLARHLLNKSEDPQMKRWVILSLLGTYYHNFVTHLLEGAFQREVYRVAEEGEPLTSKRLNELKYNVLAGFWGDAVELDDGAALTWMRQPHYYMGLYPYTYSAGLTASTAVSGKIIQEGQPAIERWLSMLKAGGTLDPIELLKKGGVDMTTSEPISQAVSYVGSLIDELEKSF
ncbi:oligoendopeptidase F [Natribacillus halophilus]|uniref:Oligopeptidase F n=1 Tax=Natribacillus halophilus TaxID=549003 RepID=A0A1G8J555_9BACI|nr:oligoendopeptidase F [Natribacillus halophilus]SDI26212.1 oligoendopeptidase F [Natribacillus halophilus]